MTAKEKEEEDSVAYCQMSITWGPFRLQKITHYFFFFKFVSHSACTVFYICGCLDAYVWFVCRMNCSLEPHCHTITSECSRVCEISQYRCGSGLCLCVYGACGYNMKVVCWSCPTGSGVDPQCPCVVLFQIMDSGVIEFICFICLIYVIYVE